MEDPGGAEERELERYASIAETLRLPPDQLFYLFPTLQYLQRLNNEEEEKRWERERSSRVRRDRAGGLGGAGDPEEEWNRGRRGATTTEYHPPQPPRPLALSNYRAAPALSSNVNIYNSTPVTSHPNGHANNIHGGYGVRPADRYSSDEGGGRRWAGDRKRTREDEDEDHPRSGVDYSRHIQPAPPATYAAQSVPGQMHCSLPPDLCSGRGAHQRPPAAHSHRTVAVSSSGESNIFRSHTLLTTSSITAT